MDRKKFFKTGLSKIVEGAIKATEDAVKSASTAIEDRKKDKVNTMLAKEAPLRAKVPKKGLLYPPGALKKVSEFKKKCTGCRECVYACPHNALLPVYQPKLDKDLPFIDVNMTACRLCSDWPCIAACKDKALLPLPESKYPKFGKATFLTNNCLNSDFTNPICKLCIETCPVDKAIQMTDETVQINRSCIGCGLCVQVCPTFPKALQIL